MKFDVTAVIKEIGAIETVGQKGFQKRNLILSEQSGQYDNLICVEFSGDKLASPEQFSVGQTVTVSGFINCREWNGKYFTSLRGSFISIPQAPGGGDDYSQGFQEPPDMVEPEYDSFQGNAQPQQPRQPAQGFNAPQGNQSPPLFPNNDTNESIDDIPF